MKKLGWGILIRYVFEIILLYICLPALLYLNINRVPLMPVLMIMGVIFYLILHFDKSFNNKLLLNWRSTKKEIKNILFIFLPVALLMVIITFFIDKEWLFYLPRNSPLLMILISIFYPLFSVIPQGLVYRAFFMHRYNRLFKNKISIIIGSAIFFSFGHIIFKNYIALILSFLGGILFAYRYLKSKSLLASIIEHSLYGVWLFACGLGVYLVSRFVE